jgi:hypothetical protein
LTADLLIRLTHLIISDLIDPMFLDANKVTKKDSNKKKSSSKSNESSGYKSKSNKKKTPSNKQLLINEESIDEQKTCDIVEIWNNILGICSPLQELEMIEKSFNTVSQKQPKNVRSLSKSTRNTAENMVRMLFSDSFRNSALT